MSDLISVDQLINCAKQSKVLCYDIEYKANDFGYSIKDFDLHGVGFATLCEGEIIAEYYTDRELIQRIINECFTMDIHCVAHYSQSDIAGLMAAGYKVPDNFLIDDTILIMSLLDENRSTYGLKKLAKSLYAVEMDEYKEAASEGLDSLRFQKYGKLDVMVELKIFCDNYEKLVESPSYQLYRDVLTPSIRTYADIMQVGCHWDIDRGLQMYLKIVPRITELEKKIYSKLGKLNIGSTQQLANRLFRDLGYSTDGLSASKKTGAISLDKKNLEILAKRHKVCQDIITWRSLNKMLSTYLNPYMARMRECGKVTGMYSLHSDTGRTRCSGENLQNVPTGFKNPLMSDLVIREGFVARPGKRLIVSDFAGLELRVAATVCQEPFFQDAFRKYSCSNCGDSGESRTMLHKCPSCGVDEHSGFKHGADLHSMTRDSILALKGDRQAAKVINFSIIYLAGAYKLHHEYPSLSPDEWDAIIQEYMGRLPGVRRYHQKQERLYKTGKVSWDIFGRRRYVALPKRTSDRVAYMKLYKRGLNQIVNQPIQGPAATLTQIAQNDLRHLWLCKNWWKTRAVVVNSVHDEIVAEVDEDIAVEAMKDVQFCMENCQRFLDVPLAAEPKIVTNWAQGK